MIDKRPRVLYSYHDEKWPCLYMLSLAQQLVLDAAHKGSVARFVNHSCEPNAALQRWQVLGQGRLGLFATRDLLDGEEVTVGKFCVTLWLLRFFSHH